MAALQRAAAAAVALGLALRLSQPARTSRLLAAARLIPVQLSALFDVISNPRCCLRSSYVDLKSWYEHPSLRRWEKKDPELVACKCHQEQISEPLLKFAKISDTFITDLSRNSTPADGRRQLQESALTLRGVN